MKDDVVHPKRLVNIKQIKEMSGVTVEPKGLRIGALTTLGELADNVNVVKDYPALAEALNEAASPQIRNMATLGGNLCQRPRCWYFRSGFGLLPKDESAKTWSPKAKIAITRFWATMVRPNSSVRPPLFRC